MAGAYDQLFIIKGSPVRLARQGQTVERENVIEIQTLELLQFV